jgi:hypothetical protein
LAFCLFGGDIPEGRMEPLAIVVSFWMAATKNDALAAFNAFIETWGVKYDNLRRVRPRRA